MDKTSLLRSIYLETSIETSLKQKHIDASTVESTSGPRKAAALVRMRPCESSGHVPCESSGTSRYLPNEKWNHLPDRKLALYRLYSSFRPCFQSIVSIPQTLWILVTHRLLSLNCSTFWWVWSEECPVVPSEKMAVNP